MVAGGSDNLRAPSTPRPGGMSRTACETRSSTASELVCREGIEPSTYRPRDLNGATTKRLSRSAHLRPSSRCVGRQPSRGTERYGTIGDDLVEREALDS